MWVEKEAVVQLPWIPKWFYFCVRVGYCLLKCFLLIIIFINGYCPQAFLRYFMPSHCMWVLNIFHALHTTRLEMAGWEKQCKASVLSFYLVLCFNMHKFLWGSHQAVQPPIQAQIQTALQLPFHLQCYSVGFSSGLPGVLECMLMQVDNSTCQGSAVRLAL